MRAPMSMGRGRGGRGDGGRGRGGGRGFRDEGPPEVVVEVGKVLHECESEMVCKLTEKENKIPQFNAGIYLENKKKIGKIDEVRFSILSKDAICLFLRRIRFFHFIAPLSNSNIRSFLYF
jgi:hypothetical protein